MLYVLFVIVSSIAILCHVTSSKVGENSIFCSLSVTFQNIIYYTCKCFLSPQSFSGHISSNLLALYLRSCITHNTVVGYTVFHSCSNLSNLLSTDYYSYEIPYLLDQTPHLLFISSCKFVRLLFESGVY